MANHPSAEKRNRQRVKRTDRNRTVKSALRTKVKKARVSIETAATDVKDVLLDAVRSIDKAASKGVLHARAASRKKSRLARAAHKAKSATPAAAK